MSNEEKVLENIKNRLRGYGAADIIIEEMIRDARKKLQPYAKREGRKLDWWKGYFEGLVTAHCFMVLGKFPEYGENKKSIDEAIKREEERIKELTK